MVERSAGPEGAQGWDWIGVNLDDGSALMAFRMRGALIRPCGRPPACARLTAAPETLPPEAVAFEPLRHWRSPRTGITLPGGMARAHWQRNFLLQVPLMDDQELDSRRSTGAVYWEGAVRLAAEREVGRGYLEMTGYGEKIQLG
jgi:predicted secreted hydrolase